MANPPEFVSAEGEIEDAYVSDGCEIYGTVRHSVIFDGVKIGKGTVVEDSVIMSQADIGEGCYIKKTMVDVDAKIGNKVIMGVGEEQPGESDQETAGSGLRLQSGTRPVLYSIRLFHS